MYIGDGEDSSVYHILAIRNEPGRLLI